MEKIIEYFLAAIKALLALFGEELPEIGDTTKDNIDSMVNGIITYEPEV